MDRGPAIVLTLLVGGLVAFQPPVNAALARHVGNLGATLTSLTISWLIVAALLVAAGEVGELRGLSEFRPEYLLGGIGGAAIIFVTLVTVGPLGATGLVIVLVTGQITVSALLDKVGALGLEQTPLTLPRLLGIALLIGGTVLVTWR